MSRIAALVAWVGLIVVAFVVAPPARPDQGAWVVRLLTGDFTGTDPWVVAHFQAMGLWPLVLAVLARDRLRGPWRWGAVPGWPFVLGAFALGAFALLPWWILGRAAPGPAPRALASPWLPAALGAIAVALVGWASIAGDPAAWWAVFRGESFVWAMGFDFCALWALSVATVAAIERPRPSAAWCAIPLVGAAIWAVLDARRR